ncbi:spermidine synthase [compost metagenome]
MVLLALISGLINLSSQVVYQKVVSMVAGDLYTTFMAVTLTFIFGSAIGSYFGNRIRPYLAFIELGSGLFSLLVFFLLHGPFYNYKIPTVLVIAGLFLPALALGTHIPLYSYYLRRLRFGLIYCVYHFGAIFGLLGFEWYFVNAGSVKVSMLIVAGTQIALGVVIGLMHRSGRFVVEEKKAKSLGLFSFARVNKISVLSVIAASTLSFYVVLWALKTQIMLTETYRLHATSVSAAVFLWMALAGVSGKSLSRFSNGILFWGMALSCLWIQGSFPVFGERIVAQYDGALLNYFGISFVLSVYLTFPVFVSSLIFVKQTQTLQSKYDVDVASGTLNLFASFGNILGFILAGAMAAFFWTKEYFILVIALAVAMFVAISFKEKKLKVAIPLAVATLVFAGVFSDREHKHFLFKNHIWIGMRACLEAGSIQIYSHPFTTMALFREELAKDAAPDCRNHISPRLSYMIDGHVSHNVLAGFEFLSGLSSAKYFDGLLDQSLVIGIGSGQAAWSVAAISKHTQLVEISPVVITNLDHLKDRNGDLKNRKDIEFILDDGFSAIRACKPNSLDLIFNTSTYPSSFNASKLYSDEFVGLAKKCLTSRGIYQTYFDENSVYDMRTLNEFLAPIQKHFKHVDVMLEPYPQIYAYDEPKKVEKLSKADFVHAEDFSYFYELHPIELDRPCRPFLRNIARSSVASRMNTLDTAYLEQNTILGAIKSNHGVGFEAPTLLQFYVNEDGSKPVPTCE